ncbi:MAG: hypothetical protein AUJ72_01075 [Candidatus Omnitrophica bacterium CG1_02_46_14]|nr:MAG: hypothetical protein AUJ72_01075 [Candidatus Omnitrophica bacterium CG1_02_46_14]
MVYIGVVLFGVISFKLLAQELFPPISYPQLSIVTPYENAAPEEIETLITKPIEEAVGGISGLRKVSSTSKEGLSLVLVEFGWNQNMDYASLSVREKIDLIKERLPRDTQEPVVLKYNPFDRPVMVISISSRERSAIQLRELSRKWFKDEIEKVQGIASANISGGAKEQILIDVDQAKLKASKVSIVEVSDAIASANLNFPGGTIKESFYEYLVRTLGEFKHIDEIGQIPIRIQAPAESKNLYEQQKSENDPSNRLILLKDVASVSREIKERTSFSRFNGVENVTISVQKQAAANVVQVTHNVKKKLNELEAQLPKDIHVDVVSDQSKSVNNALGGVKDAGVQGGILAFLVLVIFLRDFKNSGLVITITPITVLATFTLMYFMHISLNVISMGGIALGVGMLLDNAVVVIENVYRKFRENPEKGMTHAAISGSEEVMAPMVASTLTTVSVFLPIVFVTGIAGQLFKQLALVVVVTQIISAVIAFTLLPMLINKIGGKSSLTERDIHEEGGSVKSRKLFGALLEKLGTPIRMIEKAYDKILPAFLKRKWLYLMLVLGLFILSIDYLVYGVDKVLLPKIDQGEFTLKIDMPVGTRVEFTNEITKRIEDFVRTLPDIKTISVVVGSDKDSDTKQVVESLGSSQAEIIVNLTEDRMTATSDVVQEIRKYFELSKGRKSILPARISYILNESAFGVGSAGSDAPVVINIKGPKLEVLTQLIRKAQEKVSTVEGIYGVTNNMAEPFPETKIIIDKDRASFYRLSVVNIAQAANIAMKGITASKFKEEGREIDIRVQLRSVDRDRVKKLGLLMIRSPLDMDIPLADFVKFQRGKGPSEIKRESQERTLQVFAKIHDRSLKDVVNDVQTRIQNLAIPEHYSIQIAGESQEIQESFSSLIFALALAVILVYMVMAAQFESLWQPFIIMFCLPLSMIGVALSLWVFNTPISMVAILGIILLGGIVVNNGIILIDFINQLRANGISIYDATIQAGKTRLRPILMTAFSSAFGALPLAMAKGEDALQAPLGVTAVGGILIATFLTLVVVPAIYVGSSEIAERFKK